jgi:hypothetical protein
MKRLDKPTNIWADNLLNFQKETENSIKVLQQGKLSECLRGKTELFCLPVSLMAKVNLLGYQIFHVHLKPHKTVKTVKGETT